MTKKIGVRTGINWNPSTESPGKKMVVGAFIKKGRKDNQLTFCEMRYFASGVRPCETCTESKDELCVAWADYKEFTKGITPKMIANAKAGAWGWWNEKDEKK